MPITLSLFNVDDQAEDFMHAKQAFYQSQQRPPRIHCCLKPKKHFRNHQKKVLICKRLTGGYISTLCSHIQQESPHKVQVLTVPRSSQGHLL